MSRSRRSSMWAALVILTAPLAAAPGTYPTNHEECRAKPTSDLKALLTAERECADLAKAMEAVALHCYGNGSFSESSKPDAPWTGGGRKFLAPGEADSPDKLDGLCQAAHQRCEKASAVVHKNQDVHNLNSQAEREMERGYNGKSFRFEVPQESEDGSGMSCRTSTRGRQLEYARARKVLAERHRAFHAEHDRFDTWLFMEVNQCGRLAQDRIDEANRKAAAERQQAETRRQAEAQQKARDAAVAASNKRNQEIVQQAQAQAARNAATTKQTVDQVNSMLAAGEAAEARGQDPQAAMTTAYFLGEMNKAPSPGLAAAAGAGAIFSSLLGAADEADRRSREREARRRREEAEERQHRAQEEARRARRQAEQRADLEASFAEASAPSRPAAPRDELGPDGLPVACDDLRRTMDPEGCKRIDERRRREGRAKAAEGGAVGGSPKAPPCDALRAAMNPAECAAGRRGEAAPAPAPGQ